MGFSKKLKINEVYLSLLPSVVASCVPCGIRGHGEVEMRISRRINGPNVSYYVNVTNVTFSYLSQAVSLYFIRTFWGLLSSVKISLMT